MSFAVSYSVVKPTPNFRVFGIQVAILNLLRSYLRFSQKEKLVFLVRSARSQQEIEEQARLVGCDLSRLDIRHAPYTPDKLEGIDAVFRVDPMVGELLKDRARLSSSGFAFCGLAHAIAGYEGGSVLEKYILDPSAPGDALICPSRAVQSAVQSFFDLYSDYISRRFNVAYKCPVSLPLIPLGVDLERFDKICTSEKRAQQRQALGIEDNDIAILWVGRLSAAIKAHPLAMFRAVEEAAKKTKRRVHFILCGYFAPPEAEVDFRNLARAFCPNVQIHFIDGQDSRFPDSLWAGSDIFLSLIDNIQESFGLTPIEAIAAGLPRVLSDWDGYRDCVRHGDDGFLVPTIIPPPGQGAALAQIVLGGKNLYADYLSKTALTAAVDYHAAAEALVTLIENPDCRRRMAEAARQRLPCYNWKNIIPSYEALWQNLATERQKSALSGSAACPPPSLPL